MPAPRRGLRATQVGVATAGSRGACPQQTVEYDTAREAGTAGESVEYDVVQRALNSDVMPYAPIQQGSQAPYASIADTDLQETAI